MNLNSIKNRLRAIRRNSRIISAHVPVMKHDVNYCLDLVEQGFESRASLDVSESVLKRIVEAYNLAKSQQKLAGSEYQVSNEWAPIFNAQFDESIGALSRSDMTYIRQMYKNLFRDPVSTGLHGMPVNMKKTYFSGSLSKTAKTTYLIDALYRYNLWAKLSPGYKIGDLVRPDIGNPYGILFDGSFVTPGTEYQHYYARQTLSLCKEDRPTVLELGGGYGGYAYYIHDMNKSARYIGIDLPEVLALATFYLMAAYPEKRFCLYGENHDLNDIRNADFLMWPNFMIGSVPTGEVDVVFNSYSLGEMSPETIRTYVKEFGRIAAAWVMHVNHVTHTVMSADQFGFEDAGYNLQKRQKALWNLGRQLDMDEFEFTYKHC